MENNTQNRIAKIAIVVLSIALVVAIAVAGVLAKYTATASGTSRFAGSSSETGWNGTDSPWGALQSPDGGNDSGTPRDGKRRNPAADGYRRNGICAMPSTAVYNPTDPVRFRVFWTPLAPTMVTLLFNGIIVPKMNRNSSW